MDEENISASQELTSLMPMQPMNQDLIEIIVNEEYSSLPEVTVPVHSALTEEEEFATGESPERRNDSVAVRESTGNGARKHTQEEIINKLLQDNISFSEVAELLGEGEDAEDSDLEESIPKAVSEEQMDEDHAAEFEKELNEQQRYHLKRKGNKEKRRRRRLPAALQGLMGEANLQYARSEYDEAIKMCMEIIRQYSHSPEPYQTLAMIYEDKKMVHKSLQFLLIAAFLSPNASDWEKLAELCIHQQKDIKQAIFCWGRAIRANPQNLDYHWARCDLLEQLGEKTKALKGYIHMVKFLRPDQGKDGLKLAKEIAKIHYENGDIHLAQEAMETAFRKYPSFVTAEETNLMLEVLMQREQFAACVMILVQHMKVDLTCKNMPNEAFKTLSLEDQITSATGCIVPPELPVDLTVKLAIAFIHLRKFEIAQPIVDYLTKLSTEEYGDLFHEISEAFSKVNSHRSALPLLQALISSQSYNVAAVWLLYGECLAACQRLEDAAAAYEKVVELAPQLGEPRLTLSGILQTLGRTDDALTVLSQDVRSDPIDSHLLYQKCKLLLGQNQTQEFINTAQLLFKRHFVLIRSREEAEALLSNKRLNNKYDALRELRKSKLEILEDERPPYVGQDVPIEDQWELFKKLCDVLFQNKRFVELQRVTFSALGSKEIMRDKDRAKELEFFCLLACIYNESFYFAFNIMREIIIKFPEKNRCWNLLCYIISKADDFRHNRFLLRLTHKHQDSFALAILNGHNCLVCGTYKFSLAEYSQAFKNEPKDPLIPLMLGVTYAHMACQKFSANKSSLVVTATAFLNKYLDMRMECQESFYNLGRAMHQLNLLPQAVYYYKKALAMPQPTPNDTNPDMNLIREIAFNLSLIYKKSGNFDLARMYIKNYINFD